MADDSETLSLHQEGDVLEESEENERLDEDGDEDHQEDDSGMAAGTHDDMSVGDDPDLETIKARVKEMEEEAEKIRLMQADVERRMNMSSGSNSSEIGSPLNLSIEERMEVDNKSIYVGNVDYGATAEELEAHFHGCGSINRVTILCDKYTGHPKGFAYIEFADKDSVQTAMALDESLFRGRQIKVNPKRTNKPGLSSTNRPPRGRGGRARMVIKYVYGGFRGRGRGMYNRRRAAFNPY